MKTLAFILATVQAETQSLKALNRSPIGWKWSLRLLAGLLFIGVIGAGSIAQAAMGVGNQGEGVRQLQKALNITADGIYGESTYEAVVSFQRRNNLQVDGVAGVQTLSALGLSPDLKGDGTSSTSVTTEGKVSSRVIKVYARRDVKSPVRYELNHRDRIVYTGNNFDSGDYFWQEVNGGGWIAQPPRSSSGLGTGGDTEANVQATATVTASSLVVRDAPAGAAVGELGYGARVSLTGDRETADGLSWVELTSGNWVAEDYIQYR